VGSGRVILREIWFVSFRPHCEFYYVRFVYERWGFVSFVYGIVGEVLYRPSQENVQCV
jgi:hypothetical protein